MSGTKGVLALDLSQRTGWAYGRESDDLPSYGVWHLSPAPLLAPRFVGFENEFIKALERWRPRLVLMEAPLPPHRQGSFLVARQQYGLAAFAEAECWRARVPIRERESHVVRKAVIGRGTFGSSEAAKKAVMAWCREKGLDPPTDDAGDALVLLAYAFLKAADIET